ncbi:MAG: NAD(P)/FAD-dependent oxidoreductase [Candidatus Melainabacteria bacterium]|nr:NAD(P)/FAD-dependent oxidoreductase [Candidatus Melainabacteria bacterium]OPZ90982.1 MAG: hypothetical protein BWY75_00496 [bacterium ADurb.Bin425]
MNKTTVAIIGGGVNGLTCAAYLAAAGYEVSLFEKRTKLGGLCVNETPFDKPGIDCKIKVSSVACYYGMTRHEIAEELDLFNHGLSPYLTDPVEVVMLKGGQYVFYPREGSADMAVEETTEADRKGWIEFWTDVQKAAEVIYKAYTNPTTKEKVLEQLKSAGLEKIARHIFKGSLFDLTAEYFQSKALMAVAATCTPGFANQAGSVYGCIHHGTASTLGVFGAWGQVKGGMGKVSEALAAVAQQRGANLVANLGVEKLHVVEDKITKVQLSNGEIKQFDMVIAACDLHTLFEKLIETERVPSGILAHIKANRPHVSAAKLHFLLSGKAEFSTLSRIGHNHKGVLVIAPQPEEVVKASNLVPNGQMPQELMMTMAYPTLEDESIYGAESNRDLHVLTVDVHYLPAYLRREDGSKRDWSEEDDRQLQKQVADQIEEYAPGFKQLVKDCYVVSPYGLKKHFNNESVSCWHMPMTAEFIFEGRSLPTLPHYNTPFENLYTCGSGTYPGGNVTLANGHNLAKLLIKAEDKSEDKTEKNRQEKIGTSA